MRHTYRLLFSLLAVLSLIAFSAQPIAAFPDGGCVASVEFGDLTVSDVSSCQAVFAADLDGDGDLDVLTSSMSVGPVTWQKNTDGMGTFVQGGTVVSEAAYAKGVFAADLDGDGDNDVVVGTDEWIRWFENTDGRGRFELPRSIDENASDVNSVFVADLDSDGDADLLAAMGDRFSWYENRSGTGGFRWKQNFASGGGGSVRAVDLDGDNDLDALATDPGADQVFWCENVNGAGNFSEKRLIASADGAVSAEAADLDGDGDNDVLHAALNENTIAWSENLDGDGNFGPSSVIDDDANLASDVGVADLDRDGDLDVLAGWNGGSENLAWYENQEVAGTTQFEARTLIPGYNHRHCSVVPEDMDGDGDDDVLVGTDWATKWYENDLDDCDKNGIDDTCEDPGVAAACTDHDHDGVHLPDDCDEGKPFCTTDCTDADGDGFCVTHDCDDAMYYCATDCTDCAEDCDSDGIPDSIALSVHFAAGSLAGRHDPAKVVVAEDLDGDGDIDALAHVEHEIVWFENVDSLGSFGSAQFVGEAADYHVKALVGADADGDGDIDALIVDNIASKVSWYLNDGFGGFGAAHLATSDISRPIDAFVADMDGDADNDILVGSLFALTWLENVNGDGLLWQQHPIWAASNVWSVSVADLDGDGDSDVLAVAIDDDEIAWYENLDGQGTSWSRQLINGYTSATVVIVADLDGGYGLDVVAASGSGDFVVWYQNLANQGFGPERMISPSVDAPTELFAADLDNDGDEDLLTSTYYDGLLWYENTSGLGHFGPARRIPIHLDSYIESVVAEDLDGDGDLDLLSATSYGPSDDCVAWHENLRDNCNNNEIPDVCESPDVADPCTDIDRDGVNVLADCDDADTHAWSDPGPVAGLTLSSSPLETQLTWPEPEEPGASVVRYDTLRSTSAFDFTVSAACLAWDASVRVATDDEPPVPGGVFHYLIRVENDCSGPGNLGADSDGIPRNGRVCP